MRKISYLFVVAAALATPQIVNAAVTIAHVENTTGNGQFLSSAGLTLAVGGVSVGFFSSNPLDSAFGTTINSWSAVLAAGFTDVRSIAGTTLSGGFDWDLPLPIGGSVQGIPVSSLPPGTQLYIFGFNSGTYNIATPASSFSGATQWAVIKDDNNIAPADLGVKATTLNTAVQSEILRGTDNVNDVNMVALVPEPTSIALVGVGLVGLLSFRRRASRLS